MSADQAMTPYQEYCHLLNELGFPFHERKVKPGRIVCFTRNEITDRLVQLSTHNIDELKAEAELANGLPDARIMA